MKQYLFLLWGITSLIFSSLFLACSDDEPGDKTPVFTIKEEYLQQDFDQKQSSLVIPVAVSYTHLRAHETGRNLVCRLLLEKKKKYTKKKKKKMTISSQYSS